MFTKYEKIAIERGYKVLPNGICINFKGVEVGTKGTSKTNPYYSIWIRIDTKKISIPIHRIQAYQKFGDKIYEENIVVRHLDGNNQNNAYNNIAIGTSSDNMMDQSKEIRVNKASNANKKYSDELVLEIKEYYNSGHSYKEIMEKFNISSKGTLSYIINKR